MKKLSSISAFFPAYHDGGTIPSMVLLACRALAQVTDDFEVVVVNDGSGDDPADYTGEVLADLASASVVCASSRTPATAATARRCVRVLPPPRKTGCSILTGMPNMTRGN